MHYGIISQIYKGKGDKKEKANWRPLTMLNTDYKILAKILTIRLREAMKALVHPDQTCAVPGRDIRDALLALYTTVESMNINYMDGILVSVDHMSAFDMIEWDYLVQSMKVFGFGPKFVKWIEIIYCQGWVRSSVQVNGFLTSPFLVSRGIRQGCPLSPLLYVLVSETVTNYIRNSVLVKGIYIERHEFKINCYADDTNFFVKDFESVRELMRIYQNYKSASGATLKISKTQMLLLGRDEYFQVPAEFRQYIKDMIKIYGVQVTKNGFDIKENWEGVEDALKLKEYKVPTRDLSYYGKIGVFMTYTLSKMWYIANLITPNETLCRKVEHILDKYLWYPSERNLVKKSLLKLPIENGGLKYPDIKTRIQAIRIHTLLRREITEEPQRWHFLFDFYWNITRNVSVRNLKQLRVPKLFKEIRKAVLDLQMVLMGPLVRLYATNYLPINCSLRDI